MTTSKRLATPKALILALAAALALSLALGAPQALAAELTAGSAVSEPGSTELSTSAARPKASKITSMSFKSNLLTMKWKKVAGVDGYQIVYAQVSYFGGLSEAKSLEVTKKKNAYNAFKKCTIKGRTKLKGDVLYAKIRTFKIVGGKRVYSAWSKVKPYVARTTWNRTFIAPKGGGSDIVFFDATVPGSVTNIKNKNSRIVQAHGVEGFFLEIKKPGNATVTFKCLGKKITLKAKVVKWTAPFSLFKVGSKNCTEIVNSWHSEVPNYGGDGVPSANFTGKKLNVKPAKNWKITSIEVYNKNGHKKVKNGYKAKRSDYAICINLKNTKNKATSSIYIANDSYYPMF